MPHRRRFLSTLAAFPLGASVSSVFSQQRRKEYLRVGVATALSDSALAHHIRTAVAHSTGVAIEIVPGPSGEVLDSLEAGEVNIEITHAPDNPMRVVTVCPPAMGHHVPPFTRHSQENP